MFCPSLGSSYVEESAEHFCDKSCLQVGANCNILSQDSRGLRIRCADTKEAIRAERRQQLLMKTSRQLHWKPSFQVSWSRSCTSRLEAKFRPTVKPPEVNSHSRQFLQRALQIQWMWTALAKAARRARKVRKGKVMARTARKKAKVNIRVRIRIQARTSFVGIVVRTATRARSVGWSNPKNQSGSGSGQYKGGKGKPKNGTGKGTGSWECGDQAAVVEPQPPLASSLDLASFETLVRSPHLDP